MVNCLKGNTPDRVYQHPRYPYTQNANVLMHLIYTNCVPIVTWGIGVQNYFQCEMQQLKTAVNGAIKRIFRCQWIEVPQHRASLGYPRFDELVDAAKTRLCTALPRSPNPLVQLLFQKFQL